jgi:hypothetical protein
VTSVSAERTESKYHMNKYSLPFPLKGDKVRKPYHDSLVHLMSRDESTITYGDTYCGYLINTERAVMRDLLVLDEPLTCLRCVVRCA